MTTDTTAALSLVTVQEKPFNAESPLAVLSELPTPTQLFYVRSNFDIPRLGAADWKLEISGAVERPRELRFADLADFEPAESLVLLECAGNGRRRMIPVPSGVAWDVGAVSCAVFRGVVLADVLASCGVAADAVEIVFSGADTGEVEPGRTLSFERSLPVAKALDRSVLLATHMNGEPLTPEHGAPVRLLVPQWYAVASVKWVVRMHVVTVPFHGHFQTERYIYLADPNEPESAPVREMRVRSLIAQPAQDSVIRAGLHYVRGAAWSGFARIEQVEISIDAGLSWQPADLAVAPGAAAPVLWSYAWHAQPGTHTLLARATDRAGNTQPLQPVYNRLGYGNNLIHAISVTVTD